jgi:hypothetical protein
MTRYPSRWERGHVDSNMCGGTMAVRAADAWSIARFCALVAEQADDDLMTKSLISIRDVWIDIANECELRAGRGKATQCQSQRELA